MLQEMAQALREAWAEIKRDMWRFWQTTVLRRPLLKAPAGIIVRVDLRK